MRVINHFYRVSIVIVSICMTGTPVQADGGSEIIHLYDQFNTQLNQLNLAKPMELIDEGKTSKANRMLKKIDTGVLSKFYTKAMNKTNSKCYADSNCRVSGLIFLAVITMSKYDVVAVKKINNESAKLVIVGKTTTGTEIKLILKWLLENNKWKIDSTMKVPKNWVFPHEKSTQ